MATRAGAVELKKQLTCAICLDFFKDPVILKCGHNFCRHCICTHWDQNQADNGYQCPECRTVFSKVSFTKNYLAQNLVDQLEDQDCPPRSVDSGQCEQHGEELKLYCHADRRPICVICRESSYHRHHDVSPMPEVVEDMKKWLKLRLMKLDRQQSQCETVRSLDERAKRVLKLTKQKLKDEIEADVGVLVQFLLDERDSVLERLDVEEDFAMAVLDDNLKMVELEAAAVDKAIADIQCHLTGTTRFESLTQTYRKVMKAEPFASLEPANCLADWSDFLGPLQLIMWKKMMHVLHTIPQNLTLDPDTAHPNLVVSDFDTKVEECLVRGYEPDLPSRFSRFFGVLGTAHYTSGKHYWEVDVRDKGVWYLGVTTQYSNRKGFVSLTPSDGYWSLSQQDRLYASLDDGRFTVSDHWNSPRVGVYLDYDNGHISFYDAVTMKKLYTFAAFFTEPVCPFFSTGKNDPGSRLQICHYY